MGYPRTKYLDVTTDMCKFSIWTIQDYSPFPCNDHPSDKCIKAQFPIGFLQRTAGWSELTSPIDLTTFLPSTTSPPIRKLVEFETYAQYELGFGTVSAINQATIKLLGDGSLLIPEIDLGAMESKPNWKPYIRSNIGMDLSNVANFNFLLWQRAEAISGYIANHIGYGGKLPGVMRFTFYYETSETPPPATLNVTAIDSQTRTGITGASVTATSLLGQYRATEVGAGLYTFSNIPEDEYTVIVVKTGYQIGEKTVSVKGTVAETFYLIFVGGGFELPSWWWLIPVGIGGVAVTWLLVRTARPKRRVAPTPPVIVVR